MRKGPTLHSEVGWKNRSRSGRHRRKHMRINFKVSNKFMTKSKINKKSCPSRLKERKKPGKTFSLSSYQYLCSGSATRSTSARKSTKTSIIMPNSTLKHFAIRISFQPRFPNANGVSLFKLQMIPSRINPARRKKAIVKWSIQWPIRSLTQWLILKVSTSPNLSGN